MCAGAAVSDTHPKMKCLALRGGIWFPVTFLGVEQQHAGIEARSKGDVERAEVVAFDLLVCPSMRLRHFPSRVKVADKPMDGSSRCRRPCEC